MSSNDIDIADIYEGWFKDHPEVNKFIKSPEFDADDYDGVDMPISYDELNAWYQARSRNHTIINVIFHTLTTLFTGGLFHLAWFLILRPFVIKGDTHPNFLMLFRRFRTTREILDTVKQKLDEHEKQSVEDSEVDSTDEADSTAETSVLFHDDKGYTESEADDEPESILLSLLYSRDTRRLVLQKLSDQELIDTLIKPLSKMIRRNSLEELFSRTTRRAYKYRKNFFPFYLSHNVVHQLPLSAKYISDLSADNPHILSLFITIQTTLALLGEEDKQSIRQTLAALSNIDSGLELYQTLEPTLLLCQASLNGFNMSLVRRYSTLSYAAVLECVGGDISNFPEEFRRNLISGIVLWNPNDPSLKRRNISSLKKIPLNLWTRKQQKHLVDLIIEDTCNDNTRTVNSAYSYSLNFHQLEESILLNLIEEILATDWVRYRKPNQILKRILNLTENPEIRRNLFEHLLDNLQHGQEGNRTLYGLNFDIVPADLEKAYVEFLIGQAKKYNEFPLNIFPLYIGNNCYYATLAISKLPFPDLEPSLQTELIIEIIQINSLELFLILLRSPNILNLTQKNLRALVAAALPAYFASGRSLGRSLVLCYMPSELQNEIADLAMPDELPEEPDNKTIKEFSQRIRILSQLNFNMITPATLEVMEHHFLQFICNPIFRRKRLPILYVPLVRNLTPYNYLKAINAITEGIKIEQFRYAIHSLLFIGDFQLSSDDFQFIFNWLTIFLLPNPHRPKKDQFHALILLSKINFYALNEEQKYTYLKCAFTNLFEESTYAADAICMIDYMRLDEKYIQFTIDKLLTLIQTLASNLTFNLSLELYMKIPENFQSQLRRSLLDLLKENHDSDTEQSDQIKRQVYDILCALRNKLTESEHHELTDLYNTEKSHEIKLMFLSTFWSTSTKTQKLSFAANLGKLTNVEESKPVLDTDESLDSSSGL